MWIFMENTSYGTGKGQIPGNPSARYIDRTLIRHCGSTSDYHAVTHPSFPDYLAATSGRDYRRGHLVIDIAWDEGRGGKLRANCLHSSAVNCIVPDIVISPYTRHKVSPADFSHYSLLKMTEKLLGLHFLGHAAIASTRNLCRPFGLCPRRH